MMDGVLTPALDILAKLILVLGVLVALLILDTELTVILFLTVALIYFFIFNIFKGSLENLGKNRFINASNSFNAADEALKSYKEIKVFRSHNYFIKKFDQLSHKTSISNAKLGAVSILPSYFVEIIAFISFLIILLYQNFLGTSINDSLPIIGLYGLAAYRVVPQAQQIFNQYNTIKVNFNVFKELMPDLKNYNEGKHHPNLNDKKNNNLFKSLRFSNVTFGYSKTSNILEKVDFELKSKTKIAILGKTGSGKSTMIDLLLGLLNTSSGDIFFNNKPLRSNLKLWHSLLAYVPQNIFLLDKTIIENIAFGVDKRNIDLEKIKYAAKIAMIDDFIDMLPDKYNTIIGENGSTLSGGQRQEWELQGAIYRNPKIIILDEATSALDDATSKKLIEGLKNTIETILIITHDKKLTKYFDSCFLINDGVLKKTK